MCSNQDNPDYVEQSPNEPIPSTAHLTCVLCFFVGGKAYTFSVMFDISRLLVFESINCVIDAINQYEEMEIKFPSSHDDQRKITDGFCLKSPPAETPAAMLQPLPGL